MLLLLLVLLQLLALLADAILVPLLVLALNVAGAGLVAMPESVTN